MATDALITLKPGQTGADGADGPVGPAGPSTPSADAGNLLTAGSDTFLFVDKAAIDAAAVNAGTVDGQSIAVVAALPDPLVANTIYFVTG